MAFQTVTYLRQNMVGNLREDYGTFTSTGATGEVRTRLKWLYAVQCMTPGSGNQRMTIFLNTQTTTEDQTADGGTFHYESAGTVAHRYRAIGKG